MPTSKDSRHQNHKRQKYTKTKKNMDEINNFREKARDYISKRMRSSLVVRVSDCQCTSCNGPGFDPSIRRHSGIWGAADEAVLNIVRKNRKNPPKKYLKKKNISKWKLLQKESKKILIVRFMTLVCPYITLQDREGGLRYKRYEMDQRERRLAVRDWGR
jgi:hypothetical protein